jgi:radical SAM superfamily enzyme YgiQ (UPF0313 family)
MVCLDDVRFLFVNCARYSPERVYREYPLGIGYLSSILAQNGIDVRILDLALQTDQLRQEILSFQPTIIGFSFLSPSWPFAKQCLSEIHEVFDGMLLAGGIHASLFPQETLQAGFDYVICGEAEKVILPLVVSIVNDEKGIEDVPNLAFMRHGKLVQTAPTSPVYDLDVLPMIDRSLFDLSLYNHHSLMTSRGCPYSCKFCCNWGGGVSKCRSRSPQNVVNEISYLVRTFDARLLYFADDLFFFNNSQRREFCRQILEARLDIEWVTQLRVDSADVETLRMMKLAGCKKVCFGIESGDQRTLDLIGKHASIERVRTVLREAHSLGLETKTWWILGLPGNRNQQLASLDLMLELMPNEISIHPLIPLPGSEFWTNSEIYGIQVQDRNNYDDLSYHTMPKNVTFSYIDRDGLAALFEHFTSRLRAAGYATTDEADHQSRYLLSTPFQAKGFSI